jgi:hypothetical protein
MTDMAALIFSRWPPALGTAARTPVCFVVTGSSAGRASASTTGFVLAPTGRNLRERR